MTFLQIMPRFEGRALCAESGRPDDWFPPSGGEGVLIAAQAKVVCRRCPSLDACRSYALANPEVSGIWGAWSDRERHAMRRVVPGAARKRSHCAKGHELTPENVRRDRDGQRCRLCHNAADRASRARRAAS